MNDWLALAIGNSRLHWGRFTGDRLREVFHTPRLNHFLTIDNLSEILPTVADHRGIPLVIASVVPRQTELCRGYPGARVITLADIPLKDLYPTLGIDRALAVLGAGTRYGFPCMVIDAGTALTFTTVDGERRFAGGAILPGARLQFQSLAERTAALPRISLPEKLPSLWGKNTDAAIESGIVHTLIAGIEKFIDWWSDRYRDGSIVITGGDGARILEYLRAIGGAAGRAIADDNAIFAGMAIGARQ